ncbi:complement component C1q receptor [Betta splendens]|uniref:Thrombomodulin n=1 Tax=Betta splendens TaxID=158456 RepID=A0A6P7LKV2_BETSP|nr:complement component C1q receptor [Betta splendens]
MACFRVKRKMTIFMSVLSLLTLEAGLSMSGACRPICSRGSCITVNHARVDFKSAEETCRDSDGELMTFQHETDEDILDIWSQGLNGSFWIGLRLPAGACSNLSDPFRGYGWISGGVHRRFIPTFTTWKSSTQVCSLHCVSLSTDGKWIESKCSDKVDGFLCRTEHKDACKRQGLSDPTVFQSPKGCSDYPCEHNCTDIKGGYKCSCRSGYIPDKKDPRTCQLHCGQKKCPAMCEKNTGDCYCPAGFIANDIAKLCEDIDECSMKECDQGCKNTFGSFECSCQEGFVLKSHVKCVKAVNTDMSVNTTPLTEGSAAFKNNTLKVSSAPTIRFLWIWIFVAVNIVVLIIIVRFCVVKRQRLREQNANQQSTATAHVENL